MPQATIKIYVESPTGETQHFDLSQHSDMLDALQKVEALLMLVNTEWWGNPDLDAVRAGIHDLKTRRMYQLQLATVKA